MCLFILGNPGVTYYVTVMKEARVYKPGLPRMVYLFILLEYILLPEASYMNMGLVMRKPVVGVSDKASFKPVSSATETS